MFLKEGPVPEFNPVPLAPEARVMPLDQEALEFYQTTFNFFK